MGLQHEQAADECPVVSYTEFVGLSFDMSKQLMSARLSPTQSSWDFNTSKQLMSVRLSPGQSLWDFNLT